MKQKLALWLAAVLLAAPAHAVVVSVDIFGTVVFNGVSDPPLGDVGGGDDVSISFQLDSDNFMEGVPGDTRGYVIDQASFVMSFATPVDVGLLNPFPGTPYFTLVEGFPVADGFFVSDSPISPGGAALSQEPYHVNFEVGYTGDTLNSLDILDAVGTYDFTGLTRFGFSVWDISPDFPRMEIDFSGMAIVPEPSTVVMLIGILGLLGLGRRMSF